MSTCVVVALIFFLSAGNTRASCAGGDECGTIQYRRLIGGQVVPGYQYPWIALLFHVQAPRCVAVLITRAHLLTAAHCFKFKDVVAKNLRRKDMFGIILGVYDWCDHDERRLRTVVGVDTVYLHKDFIMNENRDNDIAVILMGKSVDFPVVCLSCRAGIKKESALLVSWGKYRDYSTVPSCQQLRANITILKRRECKNFTIRREIADSRGKFCALSPGVSPCVGDGGAPLLIRNEFNNYVVKGIVSYASDYCETGPSVYTNVAAYLPWIALQVTGSGFDLTQY